MKNLSDSLSPEDLATLDTFFMEHYQANMAQLGILRPFTLLSMMFVKGLECEVPGSYEALLMKEAASREWEVLGLETIKDQVNVFEQVSTEEQVAWLVDYASNLDEFKADIEKLITAYRAEALQELIDLMDEYPAKSSRNRFFTSVTRTG